ncbi:hypothetical protein FF1_025089 [Malus domestica]
MFGALKLCGTAVPRDRNGLNFGSALPPLEQFFPSRGTQNSFPLPLSLSSDLSLFVSSFFLLTSIRHLISRSRPPPPRRSPRPSSGLHGESVRGPSSHGQRVANEDQVSVPELGQAIPPRRVAVGVRRSDFIQILAKQYHLDASQSESDDRISSRFTTPTPRCPIRQPEISPRFTTPRCPIRQPGISPRFTTPRCPNSHVVGFQTDGF